MGGVYTDFQLRRRVGTPNHHIAERTVEVSEWSLRKEILGHHELSQHVAPTTKKLSWKALYKVVRTYLPLTTVVKTNWLVSSLVI